MSTLQEQQNKSQSLLSKKGFIKDTLKLGSGTALGQVILILSMPVLSRIYTPEHFGITSLFLAFVLILSRVSGLRYEIAIMLPKQQSHARILFVLVTFITLVFSFITGSVLWLFRLPISEVLKSPQLADYMLLTGPAILIYGMVNAFNYWNTRQKRYKTLAAGRMSNNAASTVYQLAGGFAGFASSGTLITGLVLGKIIELILISVKAIPYLFTSLPTRLYKKIVVLAKRYKKFPQFNIWSILVNNISWYVPSFMLAIFFSPKIVGWYAIGERTIRAPMNFIGLAISQVFFQRGSEANRMNNLDKLFRDTVGMLARIGLLPTIIITLLGKDLFILLLGAEWAEAGVYVQLLGLWAFIWFIASPVSPIISIIEKQEMGLLFNSIILISRLFALVIGGILKSPIIAIALLGVSGILSYCALLFWIGKSVNVSITETLGLLFKNNILWSLFTTICVLLFKYFHLSIYLIIFFTVIVLAIYYFKLLQKNKKIFYAKS